MEICFELVKVSSDQVVSRSFMRSCPTLEKKVRGWQLEQIQDLCVIATNNEDCFFMSSDTFLQIAISLKDPLSLFLARISRDELTQMITDGSEPCITIRRNVLPRQGYWTKLREVSHRSPWTRAFYKGILEESLHEGKSLTEMLKVRRQRGEQCELARSLRAMDGRDAAVLEPNILELILRTVDPTDVVKLKPLARGSEGAVWKVVWGNCTYAMKSFEMEEGPFCNELDVAMSRPVLHPHIVHAFGRSPSSVMNEDEPFLLMELLDGDLLRCVYEDARATDVARLRFSRVDRLDVLLQIANAMGNLHENEVVHGDLKLGNILLSELEISGNVRYFLAKVADFGSAKRTTPSFTPNGGTTEYASPEVLERRVNRSVTVPDPPKLDVYSFGVVAYEVLTGHRAYNGKLGTDEIRQVRTGEKKLIDCTEWRKLKSSFGYFDEVIALVESCLEFDPANRPTFSTICNKLAISKSTLQDWEKKVVAFQNFVVNPKTAIIVVLFLFLRYASWVWITNVLLMVSTFSIGSRARSNFLSFRLKSKAIHTNRDK